MIPMTITPNIEANPWKDCDDLPELMSITRIGRLPRGTSGGRSTVTIVIEDRKGNRYWAQTSLRLLDGAVRVLNESAKQEGEDVRV